ncbi:MAG TPA: polymer-forming cytoskeletal protein [Nannocystis sp.]
MSQSETTLSAAQDDAVTVVAPGTHIIGRLSGQEDIRVHGTIEGRIHLAATLYVEPEGIIAAEVHAHDVVVAGTVVGNLTASGSIVLAESARVVGDLRAPRLVVAPGAAFRGQVSTDPPEEDELAGEAEASRGRSSHAWAPAAVQARPAPARQALPTMANGVRLPPQRTPRRHDDALRVRPHEPVDAGYDDGEWADGVKRAKKVARPRVLARGKHKVERI